MNKKSIKGKTLAIRVPDVLFDKFKEKCEKDSFRMSEVVRLFIRDFIENGFKKDKK